MAKRPSELANILQKRSWQAQFVRYFIGFLAVVLVSVYIGILLFGTNSVEVLLELENQEKRLQRSIEYLKMENARLQREYFELRELEAQE